MWKKVVAPTVAVSLLWVVVTASTMYYTNRLDESQTDLLAKNRATIGAAAAMEQTLWELQAFVLEGATAEDKARLEAAFLHSLDAAGAAATTPLERSLISDIRTQFGLYAALIFQSPSNFTNVRQAPPTTTETVGDAAPPPPTQEIVERAHKVAGLCQALFNEGETLESRSFDKRDQWRSKIDLVRIGFSITGLALGIFFGIWVTRGLHRSISQISVTLNLAKGDLDQEIGHFEFHPADDLGGLPELQQQVEAVSGRIRQVVEELQKARRDAVRAERLAAVGELAAGVAHELRNPLTSVKLLIQNASQRAAGKALEGKHLQVVQEEIVRMETIIQELLDFARPPQLRRVRHDIRDTLRRALNLVAGRAVQQGAELVEDVPDRPVVVDGDPERLDQVFINLLLNGIESMPGGGRLQVTVETVAREQPRGAVPGICRLTFCDSGGGIPGTVLDRLFEPFVTSRERGIGLGLAISRRIVQEHGGTLSAANQPGAGAKFVVELPLATQTDQEEIGAAPAQSAENVDARNAQAVGH